MIANPSVGGEQGGRIIQVTGTVSGAVQNVFYIDSDCQVVSGTTGQVTAPRGSMIAITFSSMYSIVASGATRLVGISAPGTGVAVYRIDEDGFSISTFM